MRQTKCLLLISFTQEMALEILHTVKYCMYAVEVIFFVKFSSCSSVKFRSNSSQFSNAAIFWLTPHWEFSVELLNCIKIC